MAVCRIRRSNCGQVTWVWRCSAGWLGWLGWPKIFIVDPGGVDQHSKEMADSCRYHQVPQMMDYDYGLWLWIMIMDYDYGLWTNGKNDGTNDGLSWNEWIMMDYERMVNEWIMDPQIDPMAIQLVDCDHICWVRFSEVWPSQIVSVAIRCGQQGPWPWKIGQHYHWTSHDKSQLAKLIDLRSGYGSIPMKIPFLMGWTSINPSYFDVNYRGFHGFWHTAIWVVRQGSCPGGSTASFVELSLWPFEGRTAVWNIRWMEEILHQLIGGLSHYS